MPRSRHFAPTPLRAAIAAALLAGSAPAFATPFTLVANSTAAQVLAGDEAGLVGTGVTLSVNKSAVAVGITGDNAVLTNLGTIAQTGTGRAVRDNTGVQNLVVNNGSATNRSATMRTADADVIQMNAARASVTLNNYGTMVSQNASAGGAQAVDFAAVQGANAVNNYAGATLLASEADAVRPGAGGVVYNAGTIRSTTATGSGSDGIDGQDNTGIRIVNDTTGTIDGARHGITAGQASAASAFTLDVTNNAGGIIRGNNGSGLNIDGVNGKQVVTVVNHGTIVGNGVTGDGDGVDVDGIANITNTGIIRSTNAYNPPGGGPASSEGITAGGGTIVNSGIIEGLVAPGNTNAVGRGITLSGNDIASGPRAGTREGLYGNATITNQAGGTIRGQGDSAIVAEGAASGFTVTIDNNAGAVILGGGAATAAIRTGADNTNIVNAGRIDGSSSGRAIQMGGGANVLTIRGGQAQIVGSIDGGSGGANRMIVDAGTGNAFKYAGTIANFASVEIKSGDTTLSGRTQAGRTVVSGGSLTLDGDDVVSPDSLLVLAGGLLRLKGDQAFASLSLEDDSAIDFGTGTLTFAGLGNIVAGKTLALLDADGSGRALRFLGDLGGDADFLTLLRGMRLGHIDVTYAFDGKYTNVSVNDVPEPASVALVLGGLGLLGALRRRGRTARSGASTVQ